MNQKLFIVKGDMAVEIPDELRDQAYDEAMDSLTQAERNRLLREAASPTQGKDEPKEKKTPGAFKKILGAAVEITGLALQAVGKVLLMVGTKLREWGYDVNNG